MPEILQGDVKAPGIGKVKKKWVVIPAGLAVGYIAYKWYQSGQDGEPAPGADGYYSTDQSELGLSTTGGASVVTGNSGNTSTDATGTDVIDNNAEWTNKAVELLSNSGYDPSVVYAALGEFLAHRALDKTEASIARSAIGAVGQPPVGGPWSVIEEASTGTGTLSAPAGLKTTGSTSNSISISWSSVEGASGYRIYRATGENVGTSVDTKFTVTGLQPDTSYPISVAAVGSAGKVGTRSSTLNAKTGRVSLGKPTGLKSSSVTKSSFRVSWTPVKGAQFYRTYINGVARGASDVPYRDFTGMKSKTSYKVTVSADVNTQVPGPQSSPLTVKTK